MYTQDFSSSIFFKDWRLILVADKQKCVIENATGLHQPIFAKNITIKFTKNIIQISVYNIHLKN